ncbi:MAG: FAD-binding oxidoreductase [Rhodospirillales bacterium]|jgi:D-amino-acid dehydrogenase|nr:FAD-binding oxidoreductase [Rhodospirillales bacterium]
MANPDVIVIGAGIVGVCSALCLQREGLRVTIITRDAPGEACSFGNSGGIGGGVSIAPLSLPGIAGKAPKMLLDPKHPLSVRWGYFPAMIPWFLRFARSSARDRVEQISDARASLFAVGTESFAPLLEAAGATDMVRNTGSLNVYESRESMVLAGVGREYARQRGVVFEEIDGDEARRLNPILGPKVACAVFFPDHAQTINPHRLVQVLAQRFTADGGALVSDHVTGFSFAADGTPSVRTRGGEYGAATVVIAAGVWSKALARMLGTRVSLEAQRGYHVMLPDPGVDARLMTTLADRNLVMSPMEHGLRITGIAEFAHPDAPPNYAHADRILAQAAEMVPGLNTEGGTRWMGPRPATPDSLPVIGRAPHHEKVVFAFGHGQNGLQMGAITGKLVAELVAGRPPSVDLAPFRPDRF